MKNYVIGVLIFALIITIFAAQNAVPVNLKLFFWEATVSLAFVVLATVLCGLFIGLALAFFCKSKKPFRIPK